MVGTTATESLWLSSSSSSSMSRHHANKPRRSPFSMSKGKGATHQRAPWRSLASHSDSTSNSPPGKKGRGSANNNALGKGGSKGKRPVGGPGPDDSRILRGAELIRQQIRKQLETSDDQRLHEARGVRDALLKGSRGGGSGSANNSGKTGSFSSDDDYGEEDEQRAEEGEPRGRPLAPDALEEFSDPWVGVEATTPSPPPPGCRKMSDDSSTIFPQLPSASLSGSDDGMQGFSDLSTILEHTNVGPISPLLFAGHPSASPPPPPDDSDNDDGVECYTPLSLLGKHPHPTARVSLRSLRNQQGLLDQSTASDWERSEASYGFVGRDYDSDLDQDDHFNSSNINSYLPKSLRGGSGSGGSLDVTKSWSPKTVSTTSTDHNNSPPLPSRQTRKHQDQELQPRRLEKAYCACAPCREEETDYDPPTTASIKETSAHGAANVAKFGDDAQAAAETTHASSPRAFLSFRRLGSGGAGKSKSSRSPPPKQPRLPGGGASPVAVAVAYHPNQFISPTTSERTDRELYCPSHPPTRTPQRPTDLVPSPLTAEYELLLHDPAYRHAQKAGLVWQSLVGQQVRFPSRWWNGARAPPLGTGLDDAGAAVAKWEYLRSARVSRVRALHRLVRKRSDPGRLLLHAIVLHQGRAVADFCVGLCHPNARGVRRGADSDPQLEIVRILWAAIRKRGSSCTLLDERGESERFKTPLTGGEDGNDDRTNRPVRITNQNVRAVYGEEPPLETVFVPQWELEQRLARRPDPLLALVQEFVLD